MDNRASSRFALVRGCKNSFGFGEFALACCVMLILFCAVANAQTATGQFNGHIYDQTGATVAGATVKVEDPATAWTRTVQSSAEGLYLLPLIAQVFPLSLTKKYLTNVIARAYIKSGLICEL